MKSVQEERGELDFTQILSRIDEIKRSLEKASTLSRELDKQRAELMARLAELAMQLQVSSRIKFELLEAFIKKPYAVVETGKPGEYILAVPRFIDFPFGYLERIDESYNYFRVNRYIDWIIELPEALKRQLGIRPPPFPAKLEGMTLVTEPDREQQVAEALGEYLLRKVEPGKFQVHPKKYFELIASLIRLGIMPFTPQPIDPKDLKPEPDGKIKLRPWQERAWEAFKQYSHIGIFWPYGCFDEDTEILTEDGWKKWHELTYDDKIATLNPRTFELEYHKPERIIVYWYEGEMFSLETNRVSLLVTPDHNLFIAKLNSNGEKVWRICKPRDISGKKCWFKKDAFWKGREPEYFTLPSLEIDRKKYRYTVPEKRIPLAEWLKFYGFWLAEGWTSSDSKGNYRVAIANKDRRILQEMKKLLEKWGFNPKMVAKGNGAYDVYVLDKQLYSYFARFGKAPEKFVDPQFKSLSPRLLRILLDYYLIGDGSGEKGVTRAKTVSKKLADDLQEIALKAGYAADISIEKRKGKLKDMFRITILRRQKEPIVNPYRVKNDRSKWVKYSGIVWDVTVPNHIIYVRRNGKAFWSGNSGKTYFTAWVLSRLRGPHLVVVPTRTLAELWRKYLREFGVPESEYEITTYHSIKKILQKNKKYKAVVFDECVVEGSLVLKSDGCPVEIQELKNGDEVVGGTVSNFFSRKTSQIVSIRTSFGVIETTPTHPHIVVRRRRDKHENKWASPRPSDIRVVQAKDLDRRTDMFLVPEKIPHVVKNAYTPEQLRFVALIACDGHVEKNKPMIKVSVRKRGEKDWIRKVFIEGVKSFGIKNKIYEFHNKRGDYTIAVYSRKLKKVLEGFGVPAGRKAQRIDISDKVFYAPLASIKAFIETCFSCEGWVHREKNGAMRLYFATASDVFATKLQLLLKKFGIHANRTRKMRANPAHSPMHQIYCGNDDFNKAMEIFSFPRKELNRSERNKCKNMGDRITINGIPYRLVRIHDITISNGDKRVYDFTANGSHTFIVNGILTHNCHHIPADVFSLGALIPRRYTIGLSGSPFREDGREYYIFALTGKPVGLTWDELLEFGVIKKPVVHVYVVKSWPDKVYLAESLLSTAKPKTLIYCDSIKRGKQLAGKLAIPFIYGGTKNRLELLEKSDVAVISRVGDEGIDVKKLRTVIEVDFLGASRRQESQRLGRLLHSKFRGEHHVIMTEEEYRKFKRRLYPLIEHGLEVIVHAAGKTLTLEPEQRPIRVSAPVRPRRERRRAPTPKAEAPPARESIDTQVSRYPPGVQKVLSRLTRPQRRFLEFLLQNQGRYFTSEELALMLGYSTPKTFRDSVKPTQLTKYPFLKVRRQRNKILYGVELGTSFG